MRLRNNPGIIELPARITDSAVHYVTINRSAVYIDGSPSMINLPSILIQYVYVGGLPQAKMFGGMTSFQGCIRDVRLNGEQLLFFNQSELKPVQKNIALECSSEDVCRTLSGIREKC